MDKELRLLDSRTPLVGYEIETERLRLRLFTPGDRDDLYDLYNDPDVMRYIGRGARTQEETEIGLRGMIAHWQQHGFGVWTLALKQERALIGRCGLCYLEQTPEVEIGYAIAKSYWGQGLATEAAQASLRYGFEHLRLDRIVGIARPQNIASRRVMEKIGMRYRKNAHYYQADVVYYEITRQQYRPDNSRYVLSKVT